MHLENLGDSTIRGGHRRWMVFVARKRVWLGLTHPPRANGIDDSMPRLAVSKLCYGAPMDYGTLWVLASSEIVVPNPNGMWSLKNEIDYFRPWHHHSIEFYISLISLTSSELQPWNALRVPWRLQSTGWLWTMEGLCGQKKGVTRVFLPI